MTRPGNIKDSLSVGRVLSQTPSHGSSLTRQKGRSDRTGLLDSGEDQRRNVGYQRIRMLLPIAAPRETRPAAAASATTGDT
jgi:hypothetical protein